MTDVAPVVFVVDDELSVRQALSRVMRSAGLSVETFASPEEFLGAYRADARGCIILDVSMPGIGGLDLQDTLMRDGIAPPIVFLTGRGDVPTSVRAMKRGAVDFLTKPIDSDELIKAVQAALEKDLASWRARAELTEARRRLAMLTAREREVLEHVISGKLNKQTAADLGTAEKTVKVHRARVMQKMQVQSLADLVRLAQAAGVAPSTPCA